MENLTNKNPGSMDHNEFEEDGNDSDLEGRLYAEIYYSNEIHDQGENFESSINNIQDIKNSSQASNWKSPTLIQNNQLESTNADSPNNSSDKDCSPRNDRTDLVSEEKEEVSSHDDKNLNLQKHVNLETQSISIPTEDSDKIVDDNISLQETPDKSRTSRQKTPKEKKNQTPQMNQETENSCTQNERSAVKSFNKKKKKTDGFNQVLNNSLTTPKSRKRTSGCDKNSGGNSKRRSLESDKSDVNKTPKSANGRSDEVMLMPVSLNVRKFSDETNFSPVVSPATMAMLFPQQSKRDKLKEIKKKKRKIETKIKKDNSKQSKKAQKSTQDDGIMEVISLDSSKDSSDEILPIVETPKAERREQKRESEKEMPMWLDISSDSNQDVSSDSDESIFEVPVPPKPQPILIDLNDSESISSDSNNSSSDGIHDLNSKSETKNLVGYSNSTSDSEYSSGSKNNSKVSKKTPKVDSVESSTENLRSRHSSKQLNPTDEESSKDNSRIAEETLEVISINTSTENSVETSVVDSVESSEENRSRLASEQLNSTDEDSDSSYSDFLADERMGENLILNCTQVQKGAKSLDDIKKLPKVTLSVEVEGSENVPVTEHNEYFEPLNDLAEPSTSKASGSLSKKKSHKNKQSEKTRKSSKEKTDEEYFFEPVSDKIKAFYNDSWGGEEFSVEETQNKMRKDPRCWAILDEDWKPSLNRQRYFLNKTKCTLCRQSGHLRANCPEPKKGPICHMCGEKGHFETRCPHKVCLTCGIKQNTFRQTCESCRKLTCKLCGSRGHKKDSCPDHWRQFHHTTSEAEHYPPKNISEVMKPSNSLFCCNCTMRGHESSTCNKYRWTQHYPTPPHITNYSKCNQMLPINSLRKSVEVINLTASPGESSRNSIKNIELEKGSNEEMSQSPAKDNSTTTTSNSKANPDKILFDAKLENLKPELKRKKSKKLICKRKIQIVLSDLQGANLEGLIAGTFRPDLKKLCLIVSCDICIKLVEGTKVVMNVKFYTFFTKMHIFKKLICFWVRLSDEYKHRVKFNLPRKTRTLILKLNNLFKQFDKLSGDIKIIYKQIETLTNESKIVRINLSKKEKRKLNGNIQRRDDKLKTIVQLLFKNNCAEEKEAVSSLRKLHQNLQQEDSLQRSHPLLDVYLQIFYYYSLIFGTYRPPKLEQMVQKYLSLNEDSADRSINNSVSSGNSEAPVEKCNNEDFDEQQHLDQEYNNQEHVDLEHVDKNCVRQEPFSPRKSFHQNSPSIPSLIEVSPRNFPPQFCTEPSTSAPGYSNTPQRRNQRSSQLEFPADDFIPISNYHPNELLELSPHFNNRRGDPRLYGRNPMHNFNTFNPRALQTSDRLANEAAYLMSKALQLNLPQLTKAGIKLGELINQNRVQWKHINHFKYLINSQHPRGFR